MATLQLPDGPFDAFLFDCDGTIADSMPLHFVAWGEALGEYGCDWPRDLFYQWGGVPIREIIERLNAMHGLCMPVEEVAIRKEQLYYDRIADLQPVPEVLEQIVTHHGRVPFAVVSGSTRESVEISLNALDLLHRFDTLVCAGEYERAKPHPDPFLKAAEILGVAPERCLVFEDTDMGIDSARAAGMAWVRVLQPHEREAGLSHRHSGMA